MTDHVTDYVRHAGMVKRYHVWPTIQVQTVGEHCWQVALIYEQILGALTSPVERLIRLHDVAELAVGDIPSALKANNPELKAALVKVEEQALQAMGIAIPTIPKYDRIRVKICDLLEMMCFGITERELGNLLAIPIIYRTRTAALELTRTLEEIDLNAVCAFVDVAERRHENALNHEAAMKEVRQEIKQRPKGSIAL